MYSKIGALPFHNSYGVTSIFLKAGILFRIWQVGKKKKASPTSSWVCQNYLTSSSPFQPRFYSSSWLRHLVVGSRGCHFMNYTKVFSGIHKFVGKLFSSSIKFKELNFLTQLVFYFQSIKTKSQKGLRFISKQVDIWKSWLIIYKSNKVQLTSFD